MNLKNLLLWTCSIIIFYNISCSNDLIENPPVNESVSIIDTPQAAISDTSAEIAFSTDKSVTVRIEFGTEENMLNQSTLQTERDSSTHQVDITGLQPGTTYYYQIALYLGYSKPIKSEIYSFTTATIGLTEDPQTTADTESATISFSTNASVTVLLEYGTSSSNLSFALPQTVTPSQSHSLQLTSLLSDTEYYYHIKLFLGSSLVSTSATYSFTTDFSSSMLAIMRRGIWLVGGISGPSYNSPVSQLDVYDPVTDTWYPDVAASATGTFTPVSFAAYAASNDKLYVIGGFEADGTCSNKVQIYDIVNNSWTQGAVITAPRANIHAALYQGVIYLVSGTTGAATAAFSAQNSMYGYNIQGNSWTSLTAPGASANRFSTVYDGVVYHMGGKSAATTYLSTHEGY
ncbi:MAG TPA: fibronectin type III domain-containing protein, partial [Spirochaetales bacterium]|nr:fibronectin type III domain-containing protein [Spirochaetales bacterium]